MHLHVPTAIIILFTQTRLTALFEGLSELSRYLLASIQSHQILIPQFQEPRSGPLIQVFGRYMILFFRSSVLLLPRKIGQDRVYWEG